MEPKLCVCIKIKLFKRDKQKLLFKYFYLNIKDYIYTWIDIRIMFKELIDTIYFEADIMKTKQ